MTTFVYPEKAICSDSVPSPDKTLNLETEPLITPAKPLTK